ncbi:uncharacterized protein LOC143145471 [Ptiloglossa arizonensis]|uniref:uncharacterized protein LOC143145471 n=1 Tax=Ptiloglossa arizonensis TaxID=3350558 RepID=UPI003FA19047
MRTERKREAQESETSEGKRRRSHAESRKNARGARGGRKEGGPGPVKGRRTQEVRGEGGAGGQTGRHRGRQGIEAYRQIGEPQPQPQPRSRAPRRELLLLLLLLLLPLLPADCRLSTATLSLSGGLVRAWFPIDESARHETTRGVSSTPGLDRCLVGFALPGESVRHTGQTRERARHSSANRSTRIKCFESIPRHGRPRGPRQSGTIQPAVVARCCNRRSVDGVMFSEFPSAGRRT